MNSDEVLAAIAILLMLGDDFTGWEGGNALREASNTTSLAWLQMMGYVVGVDKRYRHSEPQPEQLFKVSPMGMRFLKS